MPFATPDGDIVVPDEGGAPSGTYGLVYDAQNQESGKICNYIEILDRLHRGTSGLVGLRARSDNKHQWYSHCDTETLDAAEFLAHKNCGYSSKPQEPSLHQISPTATLPLVVYQCTAASGDIDRKKRIATAIQGEKKCPPGASLDLWRRARFIGLRHLSRDGDLEFLPRCLDGLLLLLLRDF